MMRGLGPALGWIFGVLFILAGLISLTENILAGFLYINAGLISIPLVREIIRAKLDLNINGWAALGIVFVLMAIAGALFQSDETDKAKELGFASLPEYQEANRAGVLDAKAWEAKKAAEAQAKATAEAKAAAEKVATEKACREDLSCWGEKHSLDAVIACESQVERLAKYDFKWTDGVLEMKFPRFKWKDQSNGVITYIGDKIQFQNGFGAFQNHIYACDYNTIAAQVLEVRAQPGRL